MKNRINSLIYKDERYIAEVKSSAGWVTLGVFPTEEEAKKAVKKYKKNNKE
jgi:hypothetical protein